LDLRQGSGQLHLSTDPGWRAPVLAFGGIARLQKGLTMQPRTVQVFVASPDDVRFERARLDHIVARLNGAFSKAAYFRCFRWEHEFYKAHKSFQDQIPEPAACDIVIVIFGTRLGTELPEDFEKRLPDGAPYPSGTAYELLSAVAAADLHERPDVYVWCGNGSESR
jgi:eukaryotic-like serine/threonine-protein kinase